MEEAGRVRRGYFVEGLGAAQFATAPAVDRLRALARQPRDGADPWQAPSPLVRDVRTDPARRPARTAVLLAAADPANPYGAALPWPERPVGTTGDDGGGRTQDRTGAGRLSTSAPASVPGAGSPALGARRSATDGSPVPAAGTGGRSARIRHRPARRAGALVVLVDGALALYVERGGRSVLSFTDDSDELAEAAATLADAARRGLLGGRALERTDGAYALTSTLGAALQGAGFIPTPQGLRLRR
jgi:ATP-dependent Lhr-like helicase